jgi:adenylate cyclase
VPQRWPYNKLRRFVPPDNQEGRLNVSAIVDKGLKLRSSQNIMQLAVAILLFSFLLRVPTADLAILSMLERLSFDLQVKLLREVQPRSAAVEPVLIGIDEGTEEVFEEPLAMWHRHLGKTMQALAIAKPKLVGMDVVLPPKSFDKLMPGLDLSFVIGLRRLQDVAPLVVVNTVDRAGKLAPVHAPFLRMLGDDAFGLDKQLEDKDRVSRRFSESELLGKDAAFPTFVGRIVRILGRDVQEGYIDFTVGGLASYVPIQQVITWLDMGEIDKLRKHFGGRVVLIGNVTQTQDRWNLPVPLSDWERLNSGELKLNQPGVMVHFQSLRSMLGDGLIVPIPAWMKWSICGLLLLFVFVPSNWRTYVFAFLIAPLLFFVISVTLITAKILIPAVTFLVLLWISVMVGAVADGTRTLMEKNRLRQSFKGSVSPAVMHEILEGNLAGGVSAKAAEICVMFSDIRGFTGLSETLSPEAVTNLLTRYFDSMVTCVHRHDGTMDKFMGDGMMVFFGAPQRAGNICVNAVNCAFDMVEALKKLNEEFAAEGLPHVEIGIGINYGKVVVGNIGSTERHNYSAIGDAVNVASRVEGLTKRLGKPIVFTDSVKAQLGDGFDMIDFGEQPIRGHSPMRLWGVQAVPARLAVPVMH